MHFAGAAYFARQKTSDPEKYRKRRFLDTLLVVFAALAIVVLWSRVLPRTSTFLGLIGAGLAVALREPLLSIAGRLAVFAGHMFTVKDRVQINQLTGDVIDIGFFYTRMLEIGSWISGDQATRRAASSYIYGEVFQRVQRRHDITIASETMDPTIQQKQAKQQPAA